MSRDIAALVASMTLEEKAAFTAGADFWTLVGQRAGRHPAHPGDRRAQRRRRSALFGARRRDRGVRAVRFRARRHLGPRAGRAGRRDAGRGGAHQGVPRPAGADGQPPPLAARRAATSSATPRTRCCRAKPAAAFVRGVQSQGVATTVKHFAGNDAEFERNTHQLGDRRPHAARALPRAVRARGARGRRARDHDRVQPAQRPALLGARRAAHRRSCAASGGSRASWSPTGSSAGSTVGSSAAGPRPRDARPGRVLRASAWATRCAPVTWPRPSSTSTWRHLLSVFDRRRRARRRPPTGRARRSTGPSTARSRARRRPRRRCCCATTASCRSTVAECARSRCSARTPSARR